MSVGQTVKSIHLSQNKPTAFSLSPAGTKPVSVCSQRPSCDGSGHRPLLTPQPARGWALRGGMATALGPPAGPRWGTFTPDPGKAGKLKLGSHSRRGGRCSSRARLRAGGLVPSILQRCSPSVMSPSPGAAFAPTDPGRLHSPRPWCVAASGSVDVAMLLAAGSTGARCSDGRASLRSWCLIKCS